MAETSWLCFGGVELSNSCRTVQYASEGLKPHTATFKGCCCTDLPAVLGDVNGYRLPHLDNAPWIDHNNTDSYDFAGFMVTKISGLDSAPSTRAVTDRLGDGATLGRKRYGPRVITVTGLIVAGSCCGTAYGLQWLNSVLAGSLTCAPGAGCGGDDLEYLACCPVMCEDSPEFTSYADCGSSAFRTLREVGLTKAPEVVEEIGGACSCCDQNCPMLLVEFELTAGRPHALTAPVMVAESLGWPVEDDDEDPLTCHTWTTAGSCDVSGPCLAAEPSGTCGVTWASGADCVNGSDDCPTAATASCLTDPQCTTTTPPSIPLPINPCVCQSMVRRQICAEIPAGTAPAFGDMVTQVQLYAGTSVLRNVRIRFYPNPLNRAFADLDQCAYCSEINVAYLPAGSTLILDGTRRRATVTCAGQDEMPAGGILFGPSGLPYTWPVLDCGSPYLVCVEADGATISDESAFSLAVVGREV